MSFVIENSKNNTMRIIGDKGNLIGLITAFRKDEMPTTEPHSWRVELMMKIEKDFNNKYEAMAFVRGAEAAMRAYRIIPDGEETSSRPEMSPPIRRR